jgi:hypothetical protein
MLQRLALPSMAIQRGRNPMASYFVATQARADGVHHVHDRSRCPPACFPAAAAEYLGEFADAGQAVTVARVRYAQARGCACCDPAALAALAETPPWAVRPSSSLRP